MGREVEVQYTVEQLVAVNPYNPDILNDLENYVNEQVRTLISNFELCDCLLALNETNEEDKETLLFVWFTRCRHKHTVLMQISAFFAFIRYLYSHV